MSQITGGVFNIQHFSTEDGPGVRTTVFLQGCGLHCLWCANPESQKATRQLAHRAPICVKCGCCIKNCPNGALAVKEGKVSIDRDKCVSCGTCTKVCPSHAMFFYGEVKDVDDVWKEVIKDRGYYDTSGGGISCSGGECMLQPDFVGELFRRAREEGIHTTLDTCGHFPTENIDKVLPFTDLVLFDLKILDREKHKKYTGSDNDLILKNLKCIHDNYESEIYIRIPVIPGYNDGEEDLRASAEFIRDFDPTLHVDLLPYHKFGIGKYEMLDMAYIPADVNAPSKEQKESYKKIFTDYGLDCVMH